ncbi:M42 family metallopeptidase [Aureibacter tunicatorum]|uniref:Aminopeptidase FrvX n=1 Tax=Aureibacter tunicatorum TaxID=866807 RepID=A0AAE3XKN0_9BACT|nr:M42 family metallopeptidase [Aureibacter tunicatorum]MDR6238368.1 putative aminopeptidase FrvX [Aureibacter tunicatorum]BDD03400.1 glucanase [Aureibacter tunicatorum]
MEYRLLEELVAIDSPTGYTDEACKYIYDFFKNLGYQPQYTNKGGVKCALGPEPVLSIAAHVDTLGAIVSGVKPDGTLRISPLGGLLLTSAEGEYVKIVTMEGKEYTGTLLLDNPAAHANKERETTNRSLDNMHIRVDEEVYNQEDVKKLGIRTGDFVCFDPRYQELSSGYIKSRFMDNKAGCLVLFEVAKSLKDKGVQAPVELYFSNFEEVGHGAASSSAYADTIEEMLVIDMGVLGEACEGNEVSCSICVKDSSGPYHFGFRKKLVELAESNSIPHKIDVYPFYGSDGSAALRGGNDFKVALIGPGVAASHGVERTHKKGIEATFDLTMKYIEDRFSI